MSLRERFRARADRVGTGTCVGALVLLYIVALGGALATYDPTRVSLHEKEMAAIRDAAAQRVAAAAEQAERDDLAEVYESCGGTNYQDRYKSYTACVMHERDEMNRRADEAMAEAIEEPYGL